MRKYRTSNPLKLAEYLNISIRYAPTDDDFKGLYFTVGNKKLIVLNETLRNSEKRNFILAHELYHAINHSEFAYFYHKDRNAKGKYEREANLNSLYICCLLIRLFTRDKVNLIYLKRVIALKKWSIIFKEEIKC